LLLKKPKRKFFMVVADTLIASGVAGLTQCLKKRKREKV